MLIREIERYWRAAKGVLAADFLLLNIQLEFPEPNAMYMQLWKGLWTLMQEGNYRAPLRSSTSAI